MCFCRTTGKQTMAKWVSVDDKKKPENNKRYLCLTDCAYMRARAGDKLAGAVLATWKEQAKEWSIHTRLITHWLDELEMPE